MLPESSPIEMRHREFIQQVVALDEVRGLEGAEGLAISSAQEAEERDVIPFWSDEAHAQAVAADDWSGFQPSAMSLAEFLENWLVGMHNDELLVGTNWDADLTGMEMEPLVLALELCNEIIAKEKVIELSNYKDIEDYREKVREASGL